MEKLCAAQCRRSCLVPVEPASPLVPLHTTELSVWLFFLNSASFCPKLADALAFRSAFGFRLSGIFTRRGLYTMPKPRRLLLLGHEDPPVAAGSERQ